MRKNVQVTYVMGAVCAALLLLAVPTALIPLGREQDVNTRIIGLLENLQSRAGDVSFGDEAGNEFLKLLLTVNANAVRVNTLDRVADMLLSEDRSIREFAARGLGELGPRAQRSPQAIPNLRRAIAEEIAIGLSTNPIHTGPIDLLWRVQLEALSDITGVPFEYLMEHPEQFEQLPPIMDICAMENSEEYCARLMADWRTQHPEDLTSSPH